MLQKRVFPCQSKPIEPACAEADSMVPGLMTCLVKIWNNRTTVQGKILVQSYPLALGHLVWLLFSHLLDVTLQHQFGTPNRLQRLLKTHICHSLILNLHSVRVGVLCPVSLDIPLNL